MAAVQAENNNNISTPIVVKKNYGDVVLTLENCLLPIEKLAPTPSLTDGLNAEDENDLRILGCELIQTAGILLKLPQVAMATGQVIFHRFYYSKSFIKHSYETVAMGCVCLASKIEEAPRRMRDVINVFHHIRQVRNGKTIQPMILDQNYINLKNQVIKSERRVLKDLGFCVHVKHPHKIIVMYLRYLQLEKNKHLVQKAWNYMNDSLRTNVFVRYSPETIACACIYLSARELQVPLPNRPSWYLVFGTKETDIQQICYTILRLYKRKKPDQDRLEHTVDALKKELDEAKLRAKGITNNTSSNVAVLKKTGNDFSPNSRSSRSNSPVKNDRSPDVKKERSKQDPNNKNNHANRRNASPDSGESNRSPTPPQKRRARSRSPSSRVYKTSRRSISRSRSRSPNHHKSKHAARSKRSSSQNRNSSGKKDKRKDKRYKSRSRSRDRHISKSRKSSRNGHHRGRSQERNNRRNN